MKQSHRQILCELAENAEQIIRPPREFGINLKLWRFEMPTLYRDSGVQKRILDEMISRGLLEWCENGNDLRASEHGLRRYRQYAAPARGMIR